MVQKHVKGRKILRGFSKVGMIGEGILGRTGVQMRQKGSSFALFFDLEEKRFCLVLLEGKGILVGWALLAEKLNPLGVVALAEIGILPYSVVSRIAKSCNILWRKRKGFC